MAHRVRMLLNSFEIAGSIPGPAYIFKIAYVKG